MKTETVATFNELSQAVPVKMRLQAAGVDAAIYDERKIQRYWFMSEPLAGVRLNVALPDYERATRLLAEWDKMEGILCQAVHCPQCYSSRVEYPQVTRKFMSPNVVEVLFAFRLMQRKFYCLDCHNTWTKESPIHEEFDLLGWPKEGGYFGHHSHGDASRH